MPARTSFREARLACPDIHVNIREDRLGDMWNSIGEDEWKLCSGWRGEMYHDHGFLHASMELFTFDNRVDVR